MPESAMTVAPAFNEKLQNESILYEPEAKNNYIPPATRKPPLASSTQAMSQPSENMAISPEPPARRADDDDYLNVTQHQSHDHLFKCMAKHTENILEQTRELQDWVYSKGDANAYNPQMVNDTVDMDEAEDPAKRPVYWISKWVDYSDKYGLGYTLADDSVGVLYNDSARLIMQKNGIHLQFIPQTIYNERLLMVNEIKPENRDLYKKLKLLRHFNNYMKEHLVQCGDSLEKDNNICRLPYLIKWYRTAKAIVLMLSTGTVQINFFSCHTKLFFDPSVEALTYIDHHKKMITYDIKELKKTGMRTDVFQKVLYCRKLISTLHAALKPDSGHTGKLLNIH